MPSRLRAGAPHSMKLSHGGARCKVFGTLPNDDRDRAAVQGSSVPSPSEEILRVHCIIDARCQCVTTP